ncbi:MAG TPA: UvrD-helicase domain-containing protein [Streptosporangiaceae bacterium]|jgi:uncharacterized protein (TIGR00375 family)
MFHADLHIHSRFSRACSKNCNLSQLAWWALRKGVTVVGTGDFTHPAWAQELKETLVPAEPGLLRLGPEAERQLRRSTPPSCGGQVRFMLSTEISTIYRGAERTRKVHHLLYAPTFAAADRITAELSKVGNLASDGRPILGLDSRHLLEITLSAGPGCYLVPAHAWTPWFAVLGSKSGFDAVADCYGDLAGHIFAIETGLSSDPAMNWTCSALDAYRLVSNSDAHSPPMLGREATTFSAELDYFSIAQALQTGAGLAGTIEFYPEEGKYHLDGHRKCGVRFEPAQTAEHDGICPECAKPLTIGVAHRVAELADRPAGYRPPGAPGFTNLVQLPQIVGEILDVGSKSKRVGAEVGRLVAALGPELGILCDIPVADIGAAGGGLLAEAITRLRAGTAVREAGYDGEYGTVRLFQPGELDRSAALFEIERPAALTGGGKAPATGAPASTARAPASSRTRAQVPAQRQGPAPADRTGPTDQAERIYGAEPAGQPGQPPAAADSVLAGHPASGGQPASQDRGGPDGQAAAAGRAGHAGEDRHPASRLLGGLDPDQRAAAQAPAPLLIIAGPGAGKTRTLACRIAYQVARHDVDPASFLAITFTRRAAGEMRARLTALAPAAAGAVTVTTFHGLGLMILREQHERAGLPAGFRVADDAERLAVAAGAAGSQRGGSRLLADAARDPEARQVLVRALAAEAMVDFDALIEMPAALLAADRGLAAATRARWPQVSVDEYQDIDAGQYELLTLLAGQGGGLTAIGDPDQAIYGFRGADVSFFLRFSTDFGAATTVQLTRNYRSSSAIVSAAMQGIRPATLVPGRVLTAVTPGEPVSFHQAADEQAEAAWIARSVDQMLGGASFHSLDSGRADAHGQDGLGLSDVAVLYRTDAQASVLGQELTRAGLPVQKRSHDALARRSSVPEIVAQLRLAALQRPADGAWTDGAASAGHDGDRASVPSLLRQVVRTLAGRVPGPRTHGVPGQAVDLLAAGEVLAPLARRCGDDLERFLTEIWLGAEADALDPRADAVTLLTLHAAKGLEFEVVFLAGCERDLLPLRLPGASLDAASLAEERRLLFVGMTRARRRLFLSCAAQRARQGSTRETGPSPLLAAIDASALARTSQQARARPVQRQLRLI